MEGVYTMKLIYNNETMTLDRNELAFQTIFTKVNELIENEKVVFSHLVVDGVEIYDKHEQYIQGRIDEILQIEIVTHTAEQMIQEAMQSIYEYLERAIPALNTLIEESYAGYTDETWQGISQLSEGMEFIVTFIGSVKGLDEKPVNWEKIHHTFKHSEEQFAMLLQVIEQQDTIEISYVLANGIVPAYEGLRDAIEPAIKGDIA